VGFRSRSLQCLVKRVVLKSAEHAWSLWRWKSKGAMSDKDKSKRAGLSLWCQRRRQQASASLGAASTLGSLSVTVRTVQAAARAVGAAGGGWALLAALRAAAAEVAGASLRAAAKCRDEKLPDAAVPDGPVPRHIAVIMDGNRRYGRQTYGDSLSGHRAGGEKLRDFVSWCAESGVEVLTVFAFSTENWKRDQEEVRAMMALFITEVPRLGECTKRLNVSVKFLASDEGPIPADVRVATKSLEEQCASCTGMRLNICLSYGGRGDVGRACRQVAQEVARGELDPNSVDEHTIEQRLQTGGLPDPDVLIRTSGERRLSNFLMFQLAYAELFFLDKHWPEVTREDLMDIIARYQDRNRRFGK
ncbi:unnamed protein product, partial [Polarella glacialis]